MTPFPVYALVCALGGGLLLACGWALAPLVFSQVEE